MRYLMALLVPLAILAVHNARAGGGASEGNVSNGQGRYEMRQNEDGYIRLDTQTGDMSICHRKNAGWTCEVIPDDRTVLETEIQRLDEENKLLRKSLTDSVENEAAPESQNGDDRVVIELPTREEILKGVDHAEEFLDEVMERFQEMIKAMKKEIDERT